MRIKANMAFQVDDETGNTKDHCSVDIYIDSLKEENMEVMKDGMASLCDGMKKLLDKV